jgi:NADPH:quinone reductase-like Zn-dependent oxidoreductase
MQGVVCAAGYPRTSGWCRTSIASGAATLPIAKTYTIDEIARAHDDMEHNRVAGKLLVSTGR